MHHKVHCKIHSVSLVVPIGRWYCLFAMTIHVCLNNFFASVVDGWTSGYTFHGDAHRVFTEFFGGENPFAGNHINLNIGCLITLSNSCWLF